MNCRQYGLSASMYCRQYVLCTSIYCRQYGLCTSMNVMWVCIAASTYVGQYGLWQYICVAVRIVAVWIVAVRTVAVLCICVSSFNFWAITKPIRLTPTLEGHLLT